MTQDEDARLDALRQLNLLDTPSSASFDRITRMAAQIFGLPISAVSLTDRDRQWFKSRVGVAHTSIPREKAPCAEVADTNQALVIPDLLADDHYADSILAGTGVRFYAGVPLVTREGFGLGSLCVLGPEPRLASDLEMTGLADLAEMVMAQIEMQHAFGRIDPLSGLPNRTQFLDDLDDLGRDSPGQRRYAVLLDLARTAQLDHGLRVLGPSFADDMVQHAARSLRAALGPGADSLPRRRHPVRVLVASDPDRDAYLALLDTMLVAAQRVSSVQLAVSPAIGVTPIVLGEMTRVRSCAPATAPPRTRVPRGARGRPLAAKDRVHARRFELLSDFGAALEAPDQLRLVFQPRIDLASGRCVGPRPCCAGATLSWEQCRLGSSSRSSSKPHSPSPPPHGFSTLPCGSWPCGKAKASTSSCRSTCPRPTLRKATSPTACNPTFGSTASVRT
jgi:hypothetical protein